MADAQAVDNWIRKNHFTLRRLHSLLGVVPVGCFLFEHMLTNSLAWWPHKFNEQVHWLHELHYLIWLEVIFIFAPITLHALYGVLILRTSRNNIREYPGYLDNWRYVLQRLTAWITIIFIIVHLGHFRFAHWFGGALYPGTPDPFGLTRAGFGWGLPPALWSVFYAVGLVAAVYHFVNGLCTFCITWGITVGVAARKRVSVVAAGLGMLMLVWGFMSLAAFRLQWGEPSPADLHGAPGASPIVLNDAHAADNQQ
ncbi:MAG: succinate dehydrogenase [Planctomycetes bacterium]|nr:succinate dehydrogenase [Planctomycetota bacterium]